MINEKEKTVKNMVLSDSAYTMYLYAKLKKSKENIKNGEVIMLDELDKESEAFYESYFIERFYCSWKKKF